jgi:hypothetical protein
MLAAFVPIVATLALLWLLEQLRHEAPVHTEATAGRPTRLFVVLVDSLAERDVNAAQMPRFSARLAREALHGPVLACADAVTVPCLLAMVKGSDRLSVFALERNFGGGERALDSGVLAELAQRGRTLAYFGEPQLAQVLRGFDHLDTARTPDLDTLRRARASAFDFTLVHLLELDDLGHLHGATSDPYRRALHNLDGALDALLATRRPDETIVVLGDHGHAQDGRHGAGLTVNTYAAYFGAPFPPRAHTMAITDHASLWSRAFGLRRSDEPTWIHALFEARVDPRTPPALKSDRGAPGWFGWLTLLATWPVAFGAADFAKARRAGALRALAAWGGLLACVSLFVARWSSLQTGEPLALALLSLVCVALGLTLRAYPTDGASYGARLFAGALVFAPPVLALLGGPRLALAVAGAALLLALTRGQTALGALAPLAILSIASLFPGSLHPDLPERFLVHAHAAEALGPLPSLATYLAAVVLAARDDVRLRALAAAIVGCIVATTFTMLPPRLGMVPCALALPLALYGLRRTTRSRSGERRDLFPALCAFAPIALVLFHQRDSERLSPLLTVVLLGALLGRMLAARAEHIDPLARAGLLLLLVWSSYWAMLGARIGGVDFDFYFRFMPAASSATEEWPWTALLTAEKYLFGSALPLLFASQRCVLPPITFDHAAALARIRLALLLAGLAIVASARMVPSSWLLGELMQECALFVLLLLTLGALGAALAETEPRAHAY